MAQFCPSNPYQISGELNYNGKQPYVYKAGIPGGRQIDPTIFTVTTNPLGAANAPRNFLRGFGETQANVAVQRSFPLHENVLMGQATATLSSSLGGIHAVPTGWPTVPTADAEASVLKES